MRKPRVCSRAVVSALALAAAWLALPAPARAEWKWTVAPYIWMSDTKLDVTVNDHTAVNADVAFSNLVDALDVGGSIHAEARSNEGGGFLLDLFFFDLNSDDARSGGPLPPGSEVLTGLKIGMYELAAYYHPTAPGKGFDLLFGVRVIDLQTQIDYFSPGGLHAGTESDKTYTDMFAGIRAGGPLGGGWDLLVRGDVATGGTDFTWNAIGTVGFNFGAEDQFGVRAGWRQMVIDTTDTDDSTTIDAEQTFKGPYVGFTWTF